MVFDTPQQRALVMSIIDGTTLKGADVEVIAMLKQAIRTSTVADQPQQQTQQKIPHVRNGGAPRSVEAVAD